MVYNHSRKFEVPTGQGDGAEVGKLIIDLLLVITVLRDTDVGLCAQCS